MKTGLVMRVMSTAFAIWSISSGALGAPISNPHPVMPRADPRSWINPADVPDSLRREHGRTKVTLAIDENGKVISCDIAESSGKGDLDRLSCDLLTSRGIFVPATDADGRHIPGDFTDAIVW